MPMIGQGTKINQLVITTTPHEQCQNPPIYHTCDTSAKLLAEQIQKNIHIAGSINRTIIDLNRLPSRYTTKFRNNIRTAIQSFISTIQPNDTKNIIYILDCHSFPPNTHSFYNIRISEPDIAILFDNPNHLIYMDELISTMADNQIKATKHIGINNDIIDEFSHINDQNITLIPVLIELNESINDPIKLRKIGESIDRWIINVNNFLFPTMD